MWHLWWIVGLYDLVLRRIVNILELLWIGVRVYLFELVVHIALRISKLAETLP